MSNQRSKVFRDAVHGLISIDEDRDLLLDLINTPEFQRLRRVRQLGVSSLTYPNAEHTRFAHSIGVLHVATRIIDTLLSRYKGNESITSRIQAKRRHVKVAALLHDLGHSPFSHMLERLFKVGADHEIRSKSMIADPESSIPQVLREHDFTPAEIEETRDLLDTHDVPYLHDIVSSSLDADRMDYLLRDSHFTGVAYGNFDLEWVINSFCLGLDPSPLEDGSKLRLCLDIKRGQYVSEQLIVGRTHMTMQVYGHCITRLWESHLLILFTEATRLASEDKLPSETPSNVIKFFKNKGELAHAEFLRFDEPMLIAAMSIWADSDSPNTLLKRLSLGFINRNKILETIEISPKASLIDIEILKTKLTTKIGAEREGWIMDRYEFSAYKIPSINLLDKDVNTYWDGISNKAILLSDGSLDNRSTPIQNDSSLIRGIGSETMPLTRLFFLPEHHDAVNSIDSKLINKY